MNDSDLSNDQKVAFDRTTHGQFYEYYKKQSESEGSRQRFEGMQILALDSLRMLHGTQERALQVADIGCGAGTQSILWASRGHKVYGIDVNESLIELAIERTRALGLEAEYRVATATALPWADRSMDVCLVPELLEHVVEWGECLNEVVRVLAPGGVLVLTTNNKLCPIQYEFNLPLYSWYPARLKRHYERLATTVKPELANYAKYPAVNWFTYYSLADELTRRGLTPIHRFEAFDTRILGWPKRMVVRLLRASAALRFLYQMITPYTVIVAARPS